MAVHRKAWLLCSLPIAPAQQIRASGYLHNITTGKHENRDRLLPYLRR